MLNAQPKLLSHPNKCTRKSEKSTAKLSWTSACRAATILASWREPCAFRAIFLIINTIVTNRAKFLTSSSLWRAAFAFCRHSHYLAFLRRMWSLMLEAHMTKALRTSHSPKILVNSTRQLPARRTVLNSSVILIVNRACSRQSIRMKR